MDVLFVAIGLIVIVFGGFRFIQAAFVALKAVFLYPYHRFFASENTVDEAYKKKVIAKLPEYQQHSAAVDSTLQDILKD